MGTGQQSVLLNMAAFVLGDLYLDGPHRAQPGIVNNSAGITVGYAATQVAGSDGVCTLGGAGAFFGILSNPKVYPLFGTTGNPLAPSLVLPQYGKGEFVYDTTGIAVSLPAACNVGDLVYYDTTSGALATQPSSAPVSGAQQIAYASNVATVTLSPAGMPPLGVGSVITTADGQVTTITSLLTGTGGNGTYNVGTVVNHAAQSFSFTNPAAPSGKLYVPGFQVVRFSLTGAGVGVIGNLN